jgi:Ser-tRNA(Ala) deacylase AlaX
MDKTHLETLEKELVDLTNLIEPASSDEILKIQKENTKLAYRLMHLNDAVGTEKTRKPEVQKPLATEKTENPTESTEKNDSDFPPTKQDWMNDTYQFISTTNLLKIESTSEKPYLILESSIFHPQGGGQPSDIGKITSKNMPDLNVTFVKLDKTTNLVHHEIDNTLEEIQKWSEAKLERNSPHQVYLQVDENTRRLHAKLHSAGHLLDNAVAKLGLDWTGAKGHHFATSSYVEYSMSKEDKKALNDAKKKDILEKLNVSILELTESGIDTVVSKNEEGVRTVKIGGIGCACGGTHVKNVGELAGLKVKGFKSKSGNVQVKYHFE